jgi:hypothetical protein
VIALPLAHVAGLPVEETIGAFGPALLMAVGIAWARLRATVARRKAPTSRR